MVLCPVSSHIRPRQQARWGERIRPVRLRYTVRKRRRVEARDCELKLVDEGLLHCRTELLLGKAAPRKGSLAGFLLARKLYNPKFRCLRPLTRPALSGCSFVRIRSGRCTADGFLFRFCNKIKISMRWLTSVAECSHMAQKEKNVCWFSCPSIRRLTKNRPANARHRAKKIAAIRRLL
jgi:hypothetical protein